MQTYVYDVVIVYKSICNLTCILTDFQRAEKLCPVQWNLLKQRQSGMQEYVIVFWV